LNYDDDNDQKNKKVE